MTTTRGSRRVMVVLVASAALAHVSSRQVAAQAYVYPAKGQSQQQQDIDTAECNRWAQSQAPTGPSGPDRGGRVAGTVGGAARGAALGAAVGAIAGNAGKGAAAGAVVGGVGGRGAAVNRERDRQAAANDSYTRAFGACMEARGYSVR
jgi:hypothetical protein